MSVRANGKKQKLKELIIQNRNKSKEELKVVKGKGKKLKKGEGFKMKY